MNNVSTKTGDFGESGLANGERLPKDDLIFEVLGTQDELNSWLGVCIAKLSDRFDDQRQYLLKVQDTLFYLGAELAHSPKVKFDKQKLTELEQRSEQLQRSMEKDWTTKFLYPGGNETAAFLDVARTVCRRFERRVVQYTKQTEVNPVIWQYINRLSDYLFVLRCFVNSQENFQEHHFDAATNSYLKTFIKKKK